MVLPHPSHPSIFRVVCPHDVCLSVAVNCNYKTSIIDDLIEILSNDCPDTCETELFNNYCSLMVNVFFSTTRNLRELKYLSRMNLKKYLEPVKSGAGELRSVKGFCLGRSIYIKTHLLYIELFISKNISRSQCYNMTIWSIALALVPTVHHMSYV